MGTAIIEQIAQDLVSTLETITLANDYTFTVPAVTRPRRTGIPYSPAHHEIIVLAGDRSRESELDCVGSPPGIAWRQVFSLDLCLRVSEASTTPIDQLANAFEVAVVTALMSDRSRGGLAIDTQHARTDYLTADEDYEGCTLLIEVMYRTAENDPSTNV